jgi:predicted nucleic acid-binding protein
VIVLDASALIDVVCDQPHKTWVLDQLDDEVVAPAHQRAEVLSALARLVRSHSLTPQQASDALEEAMSLELELVVPTSQQVHEAFAMRERVRVVDALYVVLARERGAALVTTDQRLARAGLPVDVRHPLAGS